MLQIDLQTKIFFYIAVVPSFDSASVVGFLRRSHLVFCSFVKEAEIA